MKTESFSEYFESMRDFKMFYRKELNLPRFGNRFVCMNQLGQIIKDKKGAYTGQNRKDWLFTLYACLCAPDDCFTTSKKKVSKKRINKFRKKLNWLQTSLICETERSSSIYTYIDCIRDYLKKTQGQCKENVAPLGNLQSRLEEMLDYRLDIYWKSHKDKSKYRDKYSKTLQNIFREQKCLTHPVFFLFLPYYIFFEIAKCERLIDKNADAFTVPQLNRESLNWSIRSTPIKANSPKNIQQLQTLYNCIEQALCSELLEQEYHTIGQSVWAAMCNYPKEPLFARFVGIPFNSDNDDEDEDDEDDETDSEVGFYDGLEDYILDYPAENDLPFCVPIWKYDEWALWFHRVFKVDLVSIKEDMHRLFSLQFRPSSRQAQRETSHIVKQYENKCMTSRKQKFCLSNILLALCTIYNMRYFYTPDPFEIEDLKSAICLLTDFIIAIGESYDSDTGSLEEKWITLLRYGYPDKKYIPFDNSDDFFINPSRILVRAILLRTVALKWKGDVHKQAEIQGWFNTSILSAREDGYDTVMQMVQGELYTALTSSKRLLRDMAIWGGIKVINDKTVSSGATYSLVDAIQLWKFWHEPEGLIFSQIVLDIQKNPSFLDEVAMNLGDPFLHPRKLDLEHVDYFEMTDSMKDENLKNRKIEIIRLLPEKIQDRLEKLGELDDFEYIILLYILFSALRRRMCHHAYELCMKFVQLT